MLMLQCHRRVFHMIEKTLWIPLFNPNRIPMNPGNPLGFQHGLSWTIAFRGTPLFHLVFFLLGFSYVLIPNMCFIGSIAMYNR